MQAAAPVVQVHDLPKDASVSYGATFTAERDMRVAVVAAGYADGYSRGLSNRGEVLLAGRRARILGRVCMQLTVVDATGLEGVHAGSWATLLGGEGPEAVRPEELAEWWGTIPYEVFCLLGLNRKTFGR
jgi:alanine racemase